jgi:uncharacterized protein (TIGR02118 family)
MNEILPRHTHGRRGFVARTVAGVAATGVAAALSSRVAVAATDGASTGMLKIISILARKDGESIEDFIHHWETVHAPLVLAVPGVERYTLSIIKSSSVRTDGVGAIALKIDGIAELWFKDQVSLGAAAQSEAIKKVLADGTIFVGSEIDFIAEEKVIIPRS